MTDDADTAVPSSSSSLGRQWRLKGDDVCEEGFLDGVIKQVRSVVSGRRAKGSAFGKLVVARYQRVAAHLRQRLDICAGLEASEL